MDQHHDVPLEDVLAGIDLDSAPTIESAHDGLEVDLKALMLRRAAWDTMMCSRVAALLPKLGLTLSSPEGTMQEHEESHARMAPVLPFEQILHDYSIILGTVLSTAISSAHEVEMTSEDSIGFARQSTELILSGSRGIVAQLFYMGLLTYGPNLNVQCGHLNEQGELVIDEPAPREDGQMDGQLSFDDVTSDD